MRTLGNLKNETRPRKQSKRVGRGPSSGKGKTCGRGHKGSLARSGGKRRETYEGGQMRLFMKLPQRGFSQARFQKRMHAINLGLIDRYFEDGEVVNEESLRKHGFVNGRCHGVKLLGNGQISKKLSRIEVNAVSQNAKQLIEAAGIPLVITGCATDEE